MLKDVKKDYKKLQNIAKQQIDEKKYFSCLNTISCMANIAYHLNFKFYDDELEIFLEKISIKTIHTLNVTPIKGRWVFYDCFGFDNKGLTQQYLNTLEDLGVEFLYILENYINDTKHKDIIDQINRNKNATIYINDSKVSIKKQIENISKKIYEYKPEKSLLHLAPWSCLSIILWNRFSKIERYFINLTDHAFWLGKNTFDYCIEFREYGAYFSSNFRKTNKNKLLMSHYYPIINQTNFLGLPDEVSNKVKIFSGGTYYKVYGSNGLYFKIVKRILLKYDNTVLLFAGSGNDKPFRKFIEKNNFQNRIFLLGHRADINEIIKKSNIYLGTCPMGGGLMGQYALLNNIPTIAYVDKSLPTYFIETIIYKGGIKCSYTDLNTFYNRFDYIMKNYKNMSINTSLVSPSREEFLENFKLLIGNNKPQYEIKDFNFNKYKFEELYFDIENNYLKQYDLIKFKWLGVKYFKYDPYAAFLSFVNIMINNKQILWMKIMQKLKAI